MTAPSPNPMPMPGDAPGGGADPLEAMPAVESMEAMPMVNATQALEAPEAAEPIEDTETAEPPNGQPAEPVLGAPGAMLVIVSGPSGVGKDTILAALQDRGHKPEYHYIVTCTTRAPRPGEVPGRSYHFLSKAQFMAWRDAGELLEANEVHGNWYGTPRQEVREALARGQHAILKIDVQGAQVVKECVPDALLIFVVPPSLEALFHRLKARATETADELEIRQRNAALELSRQDDYDYVVVNEDGQVDRTAERIEQIVDTEEARHPDRRVRV